ncbi:MAG: hypothetical protein AABY83_07680 [Pseudomonadota bacterium]
MTREESVLWLRYAVYEPRLRRVAAIFFVAGTVTSIAMLGWLQQTNRVDRLNASVVAAERQLAVAEHSVAVTKAYDEAKLRLASLRSLERAPEAVTQAALLNRFKELAVRNRVTILNQQYEAGGVEKESDRFYLELTLKSSYSALRYFMNGAQRLPWPVFIKETLVERIGNEEKQVKSTLRIAVYRTMPRPQAGGGL